METIIVTTLLVVSSVLALFLIVLIPALAIADRVPMESEEAE